ncbi:MAG: RNA polymerase sigma factor [Ruminococcus sp.]|jgi:RNA polymerase sigma-70 factor (ECF subfamily)|nr:RNA polymerase sigma factor [Ruminococcus sp.]
MSQKKEKEFEKIYSEYKDTVFGICVIYLKDYQLAEDAAQETFIKVLKKHSSLRDKTKLKAWITKIAINVCRNKLLRKSRKEIPSENLPQKQVSGKYEEKLSVKDAVSRLKPELREAVILFYYQDFTQAEISRILKIPPTTVAYRIRTAKAQLKTILEED